MAVQKTSAPSGFNSNVIALFVANLIFIAGVIFVAVAVLSLWKGQTAAIILLVPGLVSLVLGWVFDDLLRKWCD